MLGATQGTGSLLAQGQTVLAAHCCGTRARESWQEGAAGELIWHRVPRGYWQPLEPGWRGGVQGQSLLQRRAFQLSHFHAGAGGFFLAGCQHLSDGSVQNGLCGRSAGTESPVWVILGAGQRLGVPSLCLVVSPNTFPTCLHAAKCSSSWTSSLPRPPSLLHYQPKQPLPAAPTSPCFTGHAHQARADSSPSAAPSKAASAAPWPCLDSPRGSFPPRSAALLDQAQV